MCEDLALLDDIGFLSSAVMWFVFGAGAVLALRVVRLLPVMFAVLGSRFSRPERLLLGWLGRRARGRPRLPRVAN